MAGGTHFDLDDLGGGKFRHVQYLRAVRYRGVGGVLLPITSRLGNSGDPNLTIGVDELVQFRLRDRLSGNAPVVHFGKGNSMVRFTPLGTANVNGRPFGDNGFEYPGAYPGADLRCVVAGHFVSITNPLKAGHPSSFAFRIDDHAGLNIDRLETPDFLIRAPMLIPPDGSKVQPIPLAWVKSVQGGKTILTVNLPPGDFAGWMRNLTLTLQPNAADGIDNELLSWVPNDNFGTSNVIAVGRANPSARATGIVRFILTDLPAGAVVSSATISLYATDDSTKTVNNWTCECHRMLISWVEGTGGASESGAPCWNFAAFNTIPWNTAGALGVGFDYATTLMASALISDPGAGNIDFSLDLSEFALMRTTNNGVEFIANVDVTGQFERFASSDHATAANRPKLVVTYTLPTGLTDSRSFSAPSLGKSMFWEGVTPFKRGFRNH